MLHVPHAQRCVPGWGQENSQASCVCDPLAETSLAHALFTLPPLCCGPPGPPAQTVSPRAAALGHRPRPARGWAPLPRRLGHPARVPAVLAPAGALPSVVVSAPPAEGPGGHGNSGASQGASPLLLAGARQPHACQTLPPWQVVCTPGEGFDAVFPALLWHATAPAWTPWALPQPGQGSVALPTLRMHAGTTPPGLPARGDRPHPRLSASACGTLPCPAAPAVRLPPPVPARRPARPEASRPAGGPPSETGEARSLPAARLCLWPPRPCRVRAARGQSCGTRAALSQSGSTLKSAPPSRSGRKASCFPWNGRSDWIGAMGTSSGTPQAMQCDVSSES